MGLQRDDNEQSDEDLGEERVRSIVLSRRTDFSVKQWGPPQTSRFSNSREGMQVSRQKKSKKRGKEKASGSRSVYSDIDSDGE